MSDSDSAPSRRDVLLGAAALSLSGCVVPSMPDAGPPMVDPQPIDMATRVDFAPASVAHDQTLFPQTVSSGVMKSSSFVAWTRAAGASQVVLRVWREVGSETQVALVKEQTLDVTTATTDGNLKFEVSGLAPATWYSYAFFSTDFSKRSPLGRVRTAFPDDWKEPLTVGATSCASYRYRPFVPLQTLAKQNMDLWLHLGDVSYNDGADSLPTFRAKWQEQFADPGYRALFPAAGAYLVWDDHDFTNNLDPEALGPTHPILLDGRRAWRETLPVEEDRAWKSYRWGQTAEFFLLDVRTERLPTTRETAQAQFISPAQLTWLQDGLTSSPCHFKVILTSIPMTNMPGPSWGGQADRWQGYAAQREAVLNFIETNAIKGVFFVSGDIHSGTIMRVEKTGFRSKLYEVTAGPAGNINPLNLVLEPGQESNRPVVFPPSQFLYAGGNFQATVLTFDPKANTVRVV
ncbi:MAG: alkaline phosphatase D family protein, partial [Archangium sp.]|nr:alkaline phosphatase D family protein [Archangium sp.]